ncbi:hypothetical protein AVEN_56110-1 [Araneus ventricosus]|uniref:Retroviral polymerase SH3-like domain-containing protein n=1 Tax=Araneus ventricosus TaxID=182803 RepID=A0A4Y2GUE2_ARAVE|nr:hypothetical protein AVEN_56110-1 [Araneus ventricosus]
MVWDCTRCAKLKIFGFIAYCHIGKVKRDKFNLKSQKCIMIGYTPNAYRLWDIKERKIVLSRNAIFDKESFISKEVLQPELNHPVVKKPNDEGTQSLDSEKVTESVEPTFKRCKRTRKVPSWFNDYNMAYLVLNAEQYVEDCPRSLEETKSR